MEECLRRFESPSASLSAKQGEHKSATKHGSSNGAMDEGSRNGCSHVIILIVVDGAANDVHVSILDEDTSAL